MNIYYYVYYEVFNSPVHAEVRQIYVHMLIYIYTMHITEYLVVVYLVYPSLINITWQTNKISQRILIKINMNTAVYALLIYTIS